MKIEKPKTKYTPGLDKERMYSIVSDKHLIYFLQK